MKTTLAVSFLSLMIGYLVGKSSTPAEDESYSKVSFQSSSRGSSVRLRTPAPITDRSQEFSRLIDKVNAFPKSHLGTSRLHAWILQLNAEEIPEAMLILLERENNRAAEVWQNGGTVVDGVIGTEMTLLLARWYELEGESALTWIQNQQHWTERETFKAEILTITDGYHRNPFRAFELSLMYLDRVRKSESGRTSNWEEWISYQVGLWNNDPLSSMEKIDPDFKLRKAYQYSSTPGSHGPPSYWPNPFLKAFTWGLINSGRSDIARRMLPPLEEGSQIAIEEALGNSVNHLSPTELKNKIDQGEIKPLYVECLEIVNKLGDTNPNEALSWYLEQDHAPYHPRSRQISHLIQESEIFKTPSKNENDDPFSQFTLNFEQAATWLEELASRGEPVEEGWVSLVEHGLSSHDWNNVRTYRKKLSPERWREIENSIIDNAITTTSELIKGKRLVFSNVKTYGMSDRIVKEFGLEDQLDERITTQNNNTRQALQELLEEMD